MDKLIVALARDLMRVILSPEYESLQKPLRKHFDAIIDSVEAIEEIAKGEK